MDEAFIGKVFETSIVAGAFVYLLIYVTKTISAAIANQAELSKEMVKQLTEFGASLENVGNTLLRIDTRVELLEKRLQDIEDRKEVG